MLANYPAWAGTPGTQYSFKWMLSQKFEARLGAMGQVLSLTNDWHRVSKNRNAVPHFNFSFAATFVLHLLDMAFGDGLST